MTNEQILENYYQAKTVLAEATEDVKARQATVLSIIKDAPDFEIETGQAKFSLRVTKTYEDSPAVELEKKKLALIKKIISETQKTEIASGDVKVVDTKYAVVMKAI